MPTPRVGLYIMVALILIQTCEVNDRTRSIEEKVNQIEVMLGNK